MGMHGDMGMHGNMGGMGGMGGSMPTAFDMFSQQKPIDLLENGGLTDILAKMGSEGMLDQLNEDEKIDLVRKFEEKLSSVPASVIDAAQMQDMMGQFNSSNGDMAKQWSVFKDALTELSNKEMDWMKNNE
jgi:hypothetical protein